MDYKIFTFINNFAGKRKLLDFAGIFCASYLIWLMAFFILALGFFPPHKNPSILSKRNALLAVASGLSAWAVARLIGLVFYRARPYVAHQVNKLIEQLFIDKSFPSDHTTIAFAFACTIFLKNKIAGIVFFMIAAVIGLSRVYVGVHYPSDIIGGMILGISSALIFNKIIPS